MTVHSPPHSTRRMRDFLLTPVLTEEAPVRVPPCRPSPPPPARDQWTPAGLQVSRTETAPTSDSAASTVAPTPAVKVSPDQVRPRERKTQCPFSSIGVSEGRARGEEQYGGLQLRQSGGDTPRQTSHNTADNHRAPAPVRSPQEWPGPEADQQVMRRIAVSGGSHLVF